MENIQEKFDFDKKKRYYIGLKESNRKKSELHTQENREPCISV